MLKKQRTAFRSHPSPKCVGLTRLPAYQPWDVSSVICNLKRRRSRPNPPFRAQKIAQPTPHPTYAHVSTRRERVTRDAAHSVHRFPREPPRERSMEEDAGAALERCSCSLCRWARRHTRARFHSRQHGPIVDAACTAPRSLGDQCGSARCRGSARAPPRLTVLMRMRVVASSSRCVARRLTSPGYRPRSQPACVCLRSKFSMPRCAHQTCVASQRREFGRFPTNLIALTPSQFHIAGTQ